VLLKVYAKCIDGQDAIARRRIDEALRNQDDGREGDRELGRVWARPAAQRCIPSRMTALRKIRKSESLPSSPGHGHWSDRVVRGGVEPPTFRFSGIGICPGQGRDKQSACTARALSVLRHDRLGQPCCVPVGGQLGQRRGYFRIPPFHCAPPRRAPRRALALRPRSRGRSRRRLSSRPSHVPHPRCSMACGHPRLNPSESRRRGQLSGMGWLWLPGQRRGMLTRGCPTRLQRSRPVSQTHLTIYCASPYRLATPNL